MENIQENIIIRKKRGRKTMKGKVIIVSDTLDQRVTSTTELILGPSECPRVEVRSVIIQRLKTGQTYNPLKYDIKKMRRARVRRNKEEMTHVN
jgi:hypothetical protein